MSEPLFIHSRDNARLKELRRLAQDGGAYRKVGRIWLEGDHLCRAALARGWQPLEAIFSGSYWKKGQWNQPREATKIIVLDDALFQGISSLESPAGMGFILPLPAPGAGVEAGLSTVVLDRVQDAGNVGSILRSAAALGARQVVALKGTAALWSPKVLRAGMGAHFALRLVEGVDATSLDALGVPLIVTSSHQGDGLPEARLPLPCAWVFGHEGQGVSPELAARAALSVRIPQPGGEESLNVAAAAAICLYASLSVQPGRMGKAGL